MTDSASPIASLFESIEDYTNSSLELYKLKAIDKSADLISSLVWQITILIAGALAFLIFNIGLAFWLGNYFGETYYGFFVIGGLYCLLAVLLYVFRHKWIKGPINDSLIKNMLKQKGN